VKDVAAITKIHSLTDYLQYFPSLWHKNLGAFVRFCSLYEIRTKADLNV